MLFSYFECDNCNSLFSKYETAFANYFGINHTFARVSGKNKIPKYKGENGSFALNTASFTIEEIATKIADRVLSD